MAITTWAKAKSVLELDDDKETLVEALIPLVEADYEAIRNKAFDTYTKLTVTNGATADGDITVTVSDAYSELSYDVKVKENDSTFLVAQRIASRLDNRNVVADKDDVLFFGVGLVLSFDGGTTGATADVTGMATHYPKGAEYTAIKMINYHLQAADAMGLASESLGDYSVSYDRGATIADYPKDVVGNIKRHVKIV